MKAEEFLSRPQPMTDEQRADKAEILELLNYERFCRDNAMWDAMRTCYAEDSEVNISWYHGNGAGFVTASEKLNTYAPHIIHNSLTWLNGGRAVTVMMATLQIRQNLDGVACELSSEVQLLFSTEKIGGQWYIKSFESVYLQDRLAPVLPVSSLSLDTSELAKYRASYSCMSYFAERMGIHDNQELAGIDRPETVKAVYDKLSRWLAGKE